MFVKGLNGKYSGQKFELDENITFGRNAGSCNVIFDDGQEGISRIHCRIIVEGNGLRIEDLGSSYGTFLNGNKLTPNVPVPINQGDSFYLGDRKNLFSIEASPEYNALDKGGKDFYALFKSLSMNVKIGIAVGAALLVLLIVGIAMGSKNGEPEGLVGTWDLVGDESMKYIFTENGELYISQNGKFEINGSCTYNSSGDHMVTIKYTAPEKQTTDEVGEDLGINAGITIGGGPLPFEIGINPSIGVNNSVGTVTTEQLSRGLVLKYSYDISKKTMIFRDLSDNILFELKKVSD